MRIVQNTSGGAITQGMALKYSGVRNKVTLMTDSDALEDFAEIAMEDAADDEFMLLKYSGYIEDEFWEMTLVTIVAFSDTLGCRSITLS